MRENRVDLVRRVTESGRTGMVQILAHQSRLSATHQSNGCQDLDENCPAYFRAPTSCSFGAKLRRTRGPPVCPRWPRSETALISFCPDCSYCCVSPLSCFAWCLRGCALVLSRGSQVTMSSQQPRSLRCPGYLHGLACAQGAQALLIAPRDDLLFQIFHIICLQAHLTPVAGIAACRSRRDTSCVRLGQPRAPYQETAFIQITSPTSLRFTRFSGPF